MNSCRTATPHGLSHAPPRCRARARRPHRPQRHHARGRGPAGRVGSRAHLALFEAPGWRPTCRHRPSTWSTRPRCGCACTVLRSDWAASWPAAVARSAGHARPTTCWRIASRSRCRPAEGAAGGAGRARAAHGHPRNAWTFVGSGRVHGHAGRRGAPEHPRQPAVPGVSRPRHRPATSTPPPSSACSRAGAPRCRRWWKRPAKPRRQGLHLRAALVGRPLAARHAAEPPRA
jgi:hypothetical protein